MSILSSNRTAGLLIDTNLLVLFIVGTVNPNRINSFKRTSKYDRDDFDLLIRLLNSVNKPLFTVTQVMAEVSNLTDLSGPERLLARQSLKRTIGILHEPEVPSVNAAQDSKFERLGITDAAILTVAREHRCAVVTDDLDLYYALSQDNSEVLNFAHLQLRGWEAHPAN